MRFSHVSVNAAEIAFAWTTVVITLYLAILRTLAMSRGTIGRDFLMLGTHVVSALSVVGWVLVHSEFDPNELVLCRLSKSLQYTGEYMRRIFALCVYWLRLNTVIGPVYPIWLRYPTLLPIPLCLFSLCLVLSTEREGAFISDDGSCSVSQSNTSYFIRYYTFEIFDLLQAITSIGYLALFIFPLMKYKDEVLNRIMKKHILIAAIDIILELLFFIVLFGTGRYSVFSSYLAAQVIVYVGMISSNIILIFVFKDWRKYLCITERCKNRGKDPFKKPLNTREKIAIEACSLEERLLS